MCLEDGPRLTVNYLKTTTGYFERWPTYDLVPHLIFLPCVLTDPCMDQQVSLHMLVKC